MAGVYDPKVIELIPGVPEFLRWCRDKCGGEKELRDSLFIYRHAGTGAFMLARWLCYRSVFLPVLEIGRESPAGNPQACSRFLDYLHPPSDKDQLAALQAAKSNQRHDAEEFDNDRCENRAKMLRDECGIKVRRTDGGVFAPTSVLAG